MYFITKLIMILIKFILLVMCGLTVKERLRRKLSGKTIYHLMRRELIVRYQVSRTKGEMRLFWENNQEPSYFSKAMNINCDEERHFFCQLELETKRVCPADYFSYKDSCFYKSGAPALPHKAKEQCANRGGKIMDIKNHALYQFIQLYSQHVRAFDVHLGFNMTKGVDQLYADGTLYNSNNSYDFGGENINFGGLDCVYLKRGIGFKPREIECSHVLDFYCLWRRT